MTTLKITKLMLLQAPATATPGPCASCSAPAGECRCGDYVQAPGRATVGMLLASLRSIAAETEPVMADMFPPSAEDLAAHADRVAEAQALLDWWHADGIRRREQIDAAWAAVEAAWASGDADAQRLAGTHWSCVCGGTEVVDCRCPLCRDGGAL